VDARRAGGMMSRPRRRRGPDQGLARNDHEKSWGATLRSEYEEKSRVVPGGRIIRRAAHASLPIPPKLSFPDRNVLFVPDRNVPFVPDRNVLFARIKEDICQPIVARMLEPR
jgi:hypothetical protein